MSKPPATIAAVRPWAARHALQVVALATLLIAAVHLLALRVLYTVLDPKGPAWNGASALGSTVLRFYKGLLQGRLTALIALDGLVLITAFTIVEMHRRHSRGRSLSWVFATVLVIAPYLIVIFDLISAL